MPAVRRRRAVLDGALVVAFLEQIAERAGDKRSVMLQEAAERTAILGDFHES